MEPKPIPTTSLLAATMKMLQSVKLINIKLTTKKLISLLAATMKMLPSVKLINIKLTTKKLINIKLTTKSRQIRRTNVPKGLLTTMLPRINQINCKLTT